LGAGRKTRERIELAGPNKECNLDDNEEG